MSDCQYDISASIVTFNSINQITNLLNSIRQHCDLSRLAVLVVDNNSSDGTAQLIARDYPWVQLLSNTTNFGFGKAHNQVLPLIKSRYHAIINPDIVLLEDSIQILAEFLESRNDAVLAIPRVLNNNGSEQLLPKLRPQLKYLLARRLLKISKKARELDAVYIRAAEQMTQPTIIENASGSFLVIRTEHLLQLNGFDERFFLYFEDNDLSLRASMLGSLYFCPQTSVIHQYNRSWTSNNKLFWQMLNSMFRYFNKHGWG